MKSAKKRHSPVDNTAKYDKSKFRLRFLKSSELRNLRLNQHSLGTHRSDVFR